MKPFVTIASTMALGLLLLLVFHLQGAQTAPEGWSWKRTPVDGRITGVQACSASDVAQKLGKYEDGVYTSPSGRTFKDGVTPEVARLLLEAQPVMADLKTVVAHSTETMVRMYPQCALSNWYVDNMMAETARLTGKQVDFGLLNFGGIRVDMPGGEIYKDDIFSMFPFKNRLVYLQLKGKDIRKVLEQLAATPNGWQVVGGGKFVVQDGKLLSAEIGGKPLQDNKVYGVSTISFLLSGGDGIFMERGALKKIVLDQYILDVIYPLVLKYEQEGRPIEYQTDDRIKILKADGTPIDPIIL